jgi:glycosyltransferase involved in cell wall biosynthesis
VIQGRDIICFSNDWDGDPLSKKHIMLRLAKNNRILWVNSIGLRKPKASASDLRRVLKKLRDAAGGCRRVAENIYVYPPLALPFHRGLLSRAINRFCLRWGLRMACRRLGFKEILTWTFVPSSAEVAGNLGERQLVYHCVDEFSEFTGTDKGAMLAMEQALMEKADAVIVSSSPLYEAKRRYNPRTFLVTHGVDVTHFGKACEPQTVVPTDIAALAKPVIGFYGLIADWIDFELIRFLARSRPHWSMVLVGKVEANTDLSPLQGLPNVHLLGRKDYQLLPAYCKAFDVAILPFVVNPLTLAANPLKLREYLAAGLPVVATDIPEAQKLSSWVSVASSHSEFLEQIDTALAGERRGPRRDVSEAMRKESWDQKVEELSGIVQNLNPGASPLPSQYAGHPAGVGA